MSLINGYFQRAIAAKSQQSSRELLTAMEELNFSMEQGLAGFKLIEERPNYIDVFIEVDKEAEIIRQELISKVWQESELKRKMENFLKLRNRVAEYTISVPYEYASWFIEDGKMFYLPLCNSSDYYDFATGLARQKKDDNIFL
ncbi:MAG: hypothetical protein M0Z31_11550 [Clostridia bacterium]|nr:hypothetical protein [Clostridia bacterium]